MDYNDTLARARMAASEAESMGRNDDPGLFADTIGSALGYYQALDDWISHGGYLPAAWDDDPEDQVVSKPLSNRMQRWQVAQEAPGTVEHTWWLIIDTENEFVRAKAFGLSMARNIADGLNQAEDESEPVQEVNHLNGDPTDNRLDNLELRTSPIDGSPT